MSDEPRDESPAEQDPPEQELPPDQMIGGPPPEELVNTFRSSGGPNNYVAQPAPGYDTHGFWHSFGANGRSGYAAHAMALHWGLDKVLGVPTQLVPHRYHDIDIEQFPDDRYDLLFEWTKEAVGVPHALFISYPPDVAMHMSEMGPPLIPYCAFEGRVASHYAAEMVNGEQFRQVWAVSDFVRRAFVEAGADNSCVLTVEPGLFGGPWEGAFEPMAKLEHAQEMEGLPRSATPDDPFVFGAMGTWHSRKGFHRLVEAYFRAFKRSDPVMLQIRTSYFGRKRTIQEFKDEITEEIAAIACQLGDDDFPNSKQQPRLNLQLGTDLTDAEVIRWLGSLDCYANATFGEGLGIPHIWAKGQGVPMLSTGYGAVGEMLNWLQDNGATADFVYPYHLSPVDPEMPKISILFDRHTEWGDYRTDDLVHAMQVQFERGRQVDVTGAAMVRDRFSFERMADRIRELLPDFVDAQVLADLGVSR